MRIEVETSEARLVAIYRAIKEFNQFGLIGVPDLGFASHALESVFEMEKLEESYSKEQLRALILGFVAGLGASNIPADPIYQEDLPPLDQEQHFMGGPTGGVEMRQGKDERFIKQTGVVEES